MAELRRGVVAAASRRYQKLKYFKLLSDAVLAAIIPAHDSLGGIPPAQDEQPAGRAVFDASLARDVDEQSPIARRQRKTRIAVQRRAQQLETRFEARAGVGFVRERARQHKQHLIHHAER